MEQKSDLAIILKAVPFDERHRMITLLTQSHGRLSAVARNSISSRRFGGALDPFSASEVRWVEKSGADIGRIEEAQIKRDYAGLRSTWEKLTVASFFNDLLLKVAPEKEQNPDLFKIHANALATLEELVITPEKMIADRRDLFLVAGYLIKILQWAGHQPLIQNCAHCEKERSAFSSDARVCVQFETGAWICPECTDSGTQSTARPISIQVLDAAYLFLSQPYRVAANVDTYASLSSQFFLYSQHLGQYHIPGFDPGQLKSLNFLKVN